jgi:hypothetical protein
VPDAADEAMRDLVRTREDAVCMQRQARQRLQALLLRNEIRYAGKSAWTQAHRRWIAKLKLPSAAQQIAFEEYVQAVERSPPHDDSSRNGNSRACALDRKSSIGPSYSDNGRWRFA